MDDSAKRIQIAPLAELDAILRDWASHLDDVALEKRQAMRLSILAASPEQCRRRVSQAPTYFTCTRKAGHSGPCVHTNPATGVDLIAWLTDLATVLETKPYHEEAR